MVEGAYVHDSISVEMGMTGAVRATMINTKCGLVVVKMLNARTYCLYGSPVTVHLEDGVEPTAAMRLVLLSCVMCGCEMRLKRLR